MGHERVGLLPKSETWRNIVAQLEGAAGSDAETAQLAANTLNGVRKKFGRIHEDTGVQAAFGFLVGLACASRPQGTGKASPNIRLSDNPSPLSIVTCLNEWVDAHQWHPEYAVLAKRAASDVIAAWHRQYSRQGSLFSPDGPTAVEIWASASQAGGFSQVVRLFLSRFTERYLRYFLEREASANIDNVARRELLSHRLEKHAFEISKITQSFAAGWFNKQSRDSTPSDKALRAFLKVAFGKVREELRREAER